MAGGHEKSLAARRYTWCEYLLSLESKTPDCLIEPCVEIQSAPRSRVNMGVRSELRLDLLMWLQM